MVSTSNLAVLLIRDEGCRKRFDIYLAVIITDWETAVFKIGLEVFSLVLAVSGHSHHSDCGNERKMLSESLTLLHCA